jgi:uncharacterized cupredoxin-like copper-binding protein
VSRYPVVALSAVALVLGIAACGSSSSSSSTSASSASSAPASSSTASSASTSASASSAPAPAGGALTDAADPSGQLKFTKSSLSAKAGKVTIVFSNMSPLMHNMTIQQGTSGPVVGATPTFQGGTKTLTVDLKAGTYTFYCSVPGHRAAGMVGTLTVS